MAKHHPDLIMCRKQPGVGEFFFYLSKRKLIVFFIIPAIFFPPPPAIGRLCEKCEYLSCHNKRTHVLNLVISQLLLLSATFLLPSPLSGSSHDTVIHLFSVAHISPLAGDGKCVVCDS